MDGMDDEGRSGTVIHGKGQESNQFMVGEGAGWRGIEYMWCVMFYDVC